MNQSGRFWGSAFASFGLLFTLILLLDKVRLAADTIVTEPTITALEAALQKGGVVVLGFDGRVLLTNTVVITTNTIVDAVGHDVVLDGGNQVRHFIITNGAHLRLIHLTMQNGLFQGAIGQTYGAGFPGYGGSIFQSGGRLDLMECKLINNRVMGGHGGPPEYMGGYTKGGPAYGGAIYSSNGILLVTNCTFADNNCTGGEGGASVHYGGPGGDSFGGAIYCTNSLLNIVGVVFTNNSCRGGEAGHTRSTLGGGSAYGGALYEEGGASTIKESLFAGNRSLGDRRYSDLSLSTGSGNAGAIFHQNGNLIIDRTLISSNHATGGRSVIRNATLFGGNGYGGGLVIQSGQTEIRNSAIIYNLSKGGDEGGSDFTEGGSAYGGAIYVTGRLNLINCTLAMNQAQGGSSEGAWVGTGGSAYGGAIAAVEGGSVLCTNLTLSDNHVQYGYNSSMVKAVALGSSIYVMTAGLSLTRSIVSCSPWETNIWGSLGDGGYNMASDESAHFSLPTSFNGLDPQLGALGQLGGTPPTIPLLPGSPAIDAGGHETSPSTDQRGIRRPQGLACDIGAFELAPQLTLHREFEGTVRLNYLFQAEQTNQISASTDLAKWTPLEVRVTDANGRLEFEDKNAPQFPHRFYRVQIEPFQ